MKTNLLYGFVLALVGFLVSLVFYITGFHSSVEKMEATSWISNTLLFVISIVVLYLGMAAKRAAAPADRQWTYGSALGTGAGIAVFGALFGIVFTYIYFALINHNMSDLIYQVQVAKMEAKGMSSDQIEKAEPMMRAMMSPVAASLMAGVVGFIFNFLISLIVAIFVRRRPVSTPPPLAV
ncbi:DUF4199 domain-containing protein [Horticoccus luteus]|uniref:DUF4199 domain-containing protein n=1 Tax=Horticoccus luteus TaxID=2862869 RepID=A0A8F9XLP1_9BACT|nr:DUF4199 domain-containing protein [Horticoccus luteus]QYM79421.1 DUF4199 domain-containing protein [Horticoccus luteus]